MMMVSPIDDHVAADLRRELASHRAGTGDSPDGQATDVVGLFRRRLGGVPWRAWASSLAEGDIHRARLGRGPGRG